MDNPTENLKLANIKEKSITNSMLSNMQGNYNQLKNKVNELEKNNESIKKLYQSEEERLTKINNIIFSKTDEGRLFNVFIILFYKKNLSILMKKNYCFNL